MTAMPYRRRYARGEITVFLSLILSGMLGLISVLTESARVQLIRMNIESVMDASLHSCFGEYDRRMFDRYDLIFIDSSYRGGNEAGLNNTVKHLSTYMTENTDYSDTPATGEWYREKITDVKADRYILASDDDGGILKSQACEYIDKYGVRKYIQKINAYKSSAAETVEIDFFGEWDGLLTAIDAYGLTLTNPGAIVRNMVLQTDEYLTGAVLGSKEMGDCPSSRTLKKGNAASEHKKPKGSDDDFIEYIMQKCGCFTEYGSDQMLNAEIEYIIYGRSSDHDNMCDMIKRLLKLREADNLACIRGDAGKVAEAEEMAVEVAAVNIFEPASEELILLIRDSILYAWAYAESAIDVSRLLNKGRCPVKKGSSDIELALDKLLEFQSKLKGSGGEGISYKIYAGIFLSQLNDKTRRKRCMDVIEGNIRTFYNDRFRIDGCIEYLEATASFTSGYGYSHEIKRDLIYR